MLFAKVGNRAHISLLLCLSHLSRTEEQSCNVTPSLQGAPCMTGKPVSHSTSRSPLCSHSWLTLRIWFPSPFSCLEKPYRNPLPLCPQSFIFTPCWVTPFSSCMINWLALWTCVSCSFGTPYSAESFRTPRLQERGVWDKLFVLQEKTRMELSFKTI